MKPRVRPPVLSFVVTGLLCVALATDAAPEMESILVTGSYSPQPALTSSVSVLDEQTIRALNKRTIAGLLKTLPGLLVEEQGGPGGLTAVSIRGAEANFTLVLLDGLPVNDPTNSRGGGYDLANISATLVERVEVVRGAQSAIYGSGALGGVINIITRRPTQGHSQQFHVDWGEDDYSDLGVSAMGTTGALEYTAELAVRDDGEPVEGSTRESVKANLRLGWQVVEGHHLAASYHYLDGERSSYPEESGGPAHAISDELDQSDYEDTVRALGWEAQVSDRWRSKLQASRFEHEENYRSPGILPYTEVPPNGADTNYREDTLQWVNTLQFGAVTRMDLGLGYRDEEGESQGYLDYGLLLPTDFELDRRTTSLFVDASAGLLPGLLLQAALRYDDPDGFDPETTARLGVSYEFVPGLTLAGNWGQAFKLPSFFALGHALVGNPQLQPEKAEAWDLGLAWEASPELSLGATYFYNDFEDLVTFDEEAFVNINQDRVETSGVELQAQWLPLERLTFHAQATYTDIDVKDTDVPLTGRPEWTAGLLVQWRMARSWDSSLDYRYSGEQYAASRHTGEAVMTELDDYHRVDWMLRFSPAPDWQLQLTVDNLFDEGYETAMGFSGPGRSLRLGFQFTHN